MRGSRGFSLIEVLAGLVILSFIITTSLGVFYERERTHRRAEEMMLAWQVLANEAEIVRRIPYGNLGALDGLSFQSELELVEGLEGLSTRIEIEETKPMLKEVTLTLTWGEGRRDATVTVLRSDTGGTNLW